MAFRSCYSLMQTKVVLFFCKFKCVANITLMWVLVTQIAVAAPLDSMATLRSINVKQFGAKGDAKTDDTKAIQKALDYAAEKNLGNPVIFPHGGYVISSPLIMPRNVDLVGSGIGFFSSIIPVNCDGIWIKGELQDGGYSFRNKIQSLNINMNRSTKGNAIIIEKAYNIKMSDVFIYNVPEIGIYISSANYCINSIALSFVPEGEALPDPLQRGDGTA